MTIGPAPAMPCIMCISTPLEFQCKPFCGRVNGCINCNFGYFVWYHSPNTGRDTHACWIFDKCLQVYSSSCGLHTCIALRQYIGGCLLHKVVGYLLGEFDDCLQGNTNGCFHRYLVNGCSSLLRRVIGCLMCKVNGCLVERSFIPCWMTSMGGC